MDPEFDWDWLTLDDDEEVVWSATPHPYSLVPAIVVGVPLAFVLVGIAILVGAYLTHRNTRFVVTSDAIYKKTGVLSRNVQRIEFDKVQDTSYRQSFLGARFGYGTVDISTAGGGGIEMSFANVAEPQQVQTLINERLRASGGERDTEDRDAAAVMDAILAELRAIRSAVEDESGESATTPDPDEPEPAGADGSTGGPDGTESAQEGSTDRPASEEDTDRPASEGDDDLTPEPAEDGAISDDAGHTPDSDSGEFRFEDGQ